MMMFAFLQGNKTKIEGTWGLLDSQPMADFSESNLVQNIHWVSKPIHIRYNAGVRATNLI